MSREKGYYKPQKQKKSKRAPFHTGTVIDEVEKKARERIKKEEEERRKP